MEKEVEEYFKKKYSQTSIRVVPGHWPDFKSKEEVDRWINFLETIVAKTLEGEFDEDDECQE